MSGLWRLKKKNQVDHIIELDAKQEVELANTWKSPCVKMFYGNHVAKNEGSKLTPSDFHYLSHTLQNDWGFGVFCDNKLGKFKVLSIHGTLHELYFYD